MKRVAFYTLGCKLNFSESSTLARQLRARGHQTVSFGEEADVYVINTCSVTDNADKKCRKVVREALQHAPEAFVAIIGCYAQLKPQEISEIPGVNAVLGASEKFQLVDLIDQFTPGSAAQIMACDIEQAQQFHQSYSIDDRTRTFLKVQDGCDYGCAFCTIPLARGKSRSDHLQNVVDQAHEIVAQGVHEVVLTGVNLGDYGIINGKRTHKFVDLVAALGSVSGLERIRISSIEPNLLTDEIIQRVATSEKFLPHFHIPLQAGSDELLKQMRRRYLTPLYRRRVQQIKELMPNSCIGADVIVGFPGESEVLFKETYDFLVDIPVDYLHVFSYSERPNTLAATISQVVPKAQRQQRSKMLRILSHKKRRAFYEKHLGTSRKVLIENQREEGLIFGYTDNYIRVALPDDPQLVNQIVNVDLDSISESGYVLASLAEEAISLTCSE